MAIQTRYIYIISYILPLADLIMLNALYLIAIQFGSGFPEYAAGELGRNHIIICNLIWMFSATILGVYTINGKQKVVQLLSSTIKSIFLHFLMFASYLYFVTVAGFSFSFGLTFYTLFMITFIASRFLGALVHDLLFSKGRTSKKVAILGSNITAIRFSSFLQSQRNLEFYGFLGNDDGIYASDDGIIATSIVQRFIEAATYGVTDVYVAIAPQRMTEANALIKEADRHCVRLKFIPDFSNSGETSYRMSYIGDEFPVITLRNEPLEVLENRLIKRLFDIVFSCLVVVTVLSWLFPLLAIIIKLDSKGPVFFRQLRSGRNDLPFWCFKFRTMMVNNQANNKQASKDDERITAFGRFLRRTSLDELPQFINVLLGNMSVIGPRPHMLKHTSQYKKVISQFMVRHLLKPGITGWAQVNGFRGETKKHEDMEHRVRYDIYYLENWTIKFDIKIVLRTVVNMIRGEKNAY